MGKKRRLRDSEGLTYNAEGLQTAWGYTREEIEGAMRDRESVSQTNVELDAKIVKGREIMVALMRRKVGSTISAREWCGIGPTDDLK